ncbi:MAG: 3-deoxy-D-manno-octulosonic acid transferase [Candidatus Cloacimonetes bacterium HGW-Cloacimonetes-3]|nr:MAG: 3-deoxy-D-manno-octulosonic acid transferase [Candidatus Cloacimonetes bacterium HGW-Cloacimonetes-3]
MKAIFILFNALLEALFILFYPIVYFILRLRNYLPAIKAEGKDTNKGILFHAASMGEVNSIRPLVLALLEKHPDTSICITTSTITGLKLAKGISPRISACLSVLDVPHLRKKQLSMINPGLICIIETEIWLNLLFWASLHNVPVLFLNARMSAKSFGKYIKLANLLRSLSKSIVEIHVQSEDDAKRFEKVFRKPVYNSGNLKYALKLNNYDQVKKRKEWGFVTDDFILCWGSSRPGEEALVLSILPHLLKLIPNLKLIIAIRHPQRTNEILGLFNQVPYRLYSSMVSDHAYEEIVLVVDCLGVLEQAYAICDLAIVGGSFFDFGGHNPLEPAYYAKAIIMGGYYQSCRDSVKRLLLGKGIVVSDNIKLEQDILLLVQNADLRISLGKNAKQVLLNNSLALEKQLHAIEGCLR